MTAALAASSITVQIGAKTLLDDVSLSLEPGEIAALVAQTAPANPRCCGSCPAISPPAPATSV
jgi:hypothetical protein